MISLAVCLSLASYATAQIVSMVPVPADMMMDYGLGSSSYPSSSYSSAPPVVTSYSPSSSPYGSSPTPSYSSTSSSSQYTPAPPYNQYGSYSPPPAQYTPPPQTQDMSYSSFMVGGYKSMDCGYGYQKGNDGSCTNMQSWVCIPTDSRNASIDPATSGLRLVV